MGKEETAQIRTPSQDKAHFCPACGSADVKASALAGGDAACNICNWTGRNEELATFHFTHEMGDSEQVFAHFFNDMRSVLSQHFAEAIGRVLLKWGFIGLPIDKKILARYLGAAAKGVVSSILTVRQELEKERVKKTS